MLVEGEKNDVSGLTKPHISNVDNLNVLGKRLRPEFLKVYYLQIN